ncbi:MAG: hypothetical protein KVP17_004747 [Porospora cf. gigantea B]|nr:MAG: hypothetical protein KVP17_004747 [Porospora cf. gigantea B]
MVCVSTASSVAAIFVATFEAFRSTLPNGILYGKTLSLVMDINSVNQEELRLPLHVPGATLGLTGLSLDAKWKALLGCRYLYGGA